MKESPCFELEIFPDYALRCSILGLRHLNNFPDTALITYALLYNYKRMLLLFSCSL